MERIIESIVKKIGLSSNQLLKCVLLNTAIELFSYIDASAYSSAAYSSAGYLYHDWDMEDCDHSYSAAFNTGQTLENSDTCLPSCPSDWIADQAGSDHSPSVDDTVCVKSVDDLETMYLPIPENICVNYGPVNDTVDSNHLTNKSDSPESFYFLVGPVNLWLKFPLDMQAILGPESAADGLCVDDDLHCCFVQELSLLNASPGLGSAKNQEIAHNNCGVQSNGELPTANENKTLNNSKRESFSVFNNDPDAKESILWDSYDLHSSRSLTECAHMNISMLEMSWSLGSHPDEDLFTLLEEEMVRLSQQDVENLHQHCAQNMSLCVGETYPHKITTKCLGKQPLSSTPCVERTRALQLQGELHTPMKGHHSFALTM